MSEVRDYLREAQQMLTIGSPYLPEMNHLVALDEHYQVMLIKIANQLEQLKRGVLNG